MEYYRWRACERFKIKPPGVKDNWDDIDFWTQALLLGYEQGRQKEEFDLAALGLERKM